MKTVKLTGILEYYDGIQIFVARDPIGGHYICDLVDTVGDHGCYAVVGIPPERLADLRVGRVDLRTVMLESPGGEWYTTIADGTIDDPLVLEPQHKPLEETGYLPDEGYFFEEEEPVGDAEVQLALQRGKVVTVTGLVEQANRSVGEWALLTDDGIKSGKNLPRRPRPRRSASR